MSLIGNMNLISIEVTPDIASKIRFMAEEGVFALEKGSATLHFEGGKLLTIKTERYSHSRSYPQNENIDIPKIVSIL